MCFRFGSHRPSRQHIAARYMRRCRSRRGNSPLHLSPSGGVISTPRSCGLQLSDSGTQKIGLPRLRTTSFGSPIPTWRIYSNGSEGFQCLSILDLRRLQAVTAPASSSAVTRYSTGPRCAGGRISPLSGGHSRGLSLRLPASLRAEEMKRNEVSVSQWIIFPPPVVGRNVLLHGLHITRRSRWRRRGPGRGLRRRRGRSCRGSAPGGRGRVLGAGPCPHWRAGWRR